MLSRLIWRICGWPRAAWVSKATVQRLAPWGGDEQARAARVRTVALQMRFASQDEKGYGYRLLSLMRNAFGGHAVKSAGDKK